MSVRKMIAIAVIFAVSAAGWWVLGSTTAHRSNAHSGVLKDKVAELWGESLVQKAPKFSVTIPGTERTRWLVPAANKISVDLDTDYRKKGLNWYPTYVCMFDGTYRMTNTEEVTQKVRVHFEFPAADATYSGFLVHIDTKPIQAAVDTSTGVWELVELAPGQTRDFRIRYETRGTGEWRYRMNQEIGRVRNLDLKVKTNFRNVDYPEGGLSPMSADASGKGMVMSWTATDLLSRGDIGVIIPEKLNPGPLTTRITFFAPVCLVFYFILVVTIAIMYRINIHPMHYLFVAAGFFAFHLLLSYMAGHVQIHLAFGISAAISLCLVTTYLRMALGTSFPWKMALAGQLIFLVMFSYTFFLEGITGLTVSICSVITLGVLMKVTAHVDWEEVFSRYGKPKTQPVPPPIPSTGE